MKTLYNKKGFYPDKQKKLKLYFFSLFFIFSTLVLGLSYTVSQYLITNKSEEKLQENLEIELNSKKDLINNFTNSQKHYLYAITSHHLVSDYFIAPQKNKTELTNYLLSIAKTSPTIMQVRLLDKTGQEKIKILRNSYNDLPLALNKTELQNKAQRYYIQEGLRLQKDQLWFSKIDLNIEHGKIELPIVPTMRVISPIYKDDTLEGLMVINLFMDKFLEQLSKSLHFDIAILDEKNEYIKHPFDKEKSWSAYFKNRISFFEEFYIVDNMRFI